MFSEKYKAKWKAIIQIHNHSKSFYIYCEEIDLELKDFLQPKNEFLNAYTHLTRIASRHLGLAAPLSTEEKKEEGEGNGEDYEMSCLDKMLGHEYRAFFDVCDWLSISIREKISVNVGKFSLEAINHGCPKYYPEYRGKIEEINKKVAKIRDSKDIADKKTILPEVEKYKQIIDELLDIYSEIDTSIVAMNEYDLKAKKEQTEQKKITLKTGMILGVFGAAVSSLLTWLFLQ